MDQALLEKRKDLLKQFEEKAGKLDELMKKGHDLTQDDVQIVAPGLRKDIDDIKVKLEEIKSIEALDGANEEYKKYLNSPDVKGLHGFNPAGETEITPVRGEDGKVKSLLFNEEGEALLDQKTIALISSTGYKEAFNRYMRKGKEIGATDFKTLQEGIDQQGGLAKAL